MPTRRDFLHSAAIATVALTGTAVAANDKIAVACIGVRGQGGSLLNNFAAQKDVVVTHIVDLDDAVREKRGAEIEQKTGQKPKLIKNYTDILADPGIDAFVIGTPDHWHALPMIHACQNKKDVYVEKPDGHNILEGKMMVAAARKYDRMVQMGTQARSASYLHEAAEFVKSGGIGKTIFARAWETTKQGAVAKQPDTDPPAGVDYDLWLGAAPKRAFNRNRFHGSWRWFYDYGTGDLGNDGVHRMDFARWMLGVEWFTSVSCAGGKFYFDDAQEWPDTMQVTYEYPGKILVYEMRIWQSSKLEGLDEGAAIYGDAGWMLVSNSGYKAFDNKGMLIKQASASDNLQRHIRNFLDAVRSRKRETLNQEIANGHISSVMCHAGNIAWRTGEKLKFDPKTETFDKAEGNKYLGREYRKGFELPQMP